MWLKEPIIFAFGFLTCFLAFYIKNKRNELGTINFNKDLIIILSVIFIALVAAYFFT